MAPQRIAIFFCALLLSASNLPISPTLPDTAAATATGVTFSAPAAIDAGLDPEVVYADLLAQPVVYLRLGAYWDEIEANGFAALDAQMDAAAAAGKQVLLVVGVKSPRWPEYWMPPKMRAFVPGHFGIVGEDPQLRRAVLDFVTRVVLRYLDHPALYAWQVENEPLDWAGPSLWRLDPELLSAEVAVVRFLDPHHPIALTFYLQLPTSCPDPLDLRDCDLPRMLFGPPPDQADQLLRLLEPGDILGADVYTAIGDSHVPGDWTERAAEWSRRASQAGVRFWITELQAEPWETMRTKATAANAAVVTPERTERMFNNAVARSGAQVVLLWGAEHWWRSAEQDPRWLEAADEWLRAKPPIQVLD